MAGRVRVVGAADRRCRDRRLTGFGCIVDRDARRATIGGMAQRIRFSKPGAPDREGFDREHVRARFAALGYVPVEDDAGGAPDSDDVATTEPKPAPKRSRRRTAPASDPADAGELQE